MSILDANMQWLPHNGTAQKRRQRLQFIRPILKSKDPEIVKTREWLRAASEDEEEFFEFVSMTLFESNEAPIPWVEAVVEMVGDAE